MLKEAEYGEVVSVWIVVQVPLPDRALEGDGCDARSIGVEGGAGERDRAPKRRAWIVERRAWVGVVDRDGPGQRREAVPSSVGDDGTKLVVPVDERARVPGDGEGRGRIGLDRRPGPATGGPAREGDRGDA